MYLNRGLLLTSLVSGLILAQSGVTSSKQSRTASASAGPAGTTAPVTGGAGAAVPGFSEHVTPLLKKTCSPCHNERLSSGGLNVANFTDAASVRQNREAWELIVRQVRGGQMPPRGIPRPPATEMDAFLKTLDDAFDVDDRGRKPDPGR